MTQPSLSASGTATLPPPEFHVSGGNTDATTEPPINAQNVSDAPTLNSSNPLIGCLQDFGGNLISVGCAIAPLTAVFIVIGTIIAAATGNGVATGVAGGMVTLPLISTILATVKTVSDYKSHKNHSRTGDIVEFA